MTQRITPNFGNIQALFIGLFALFLAFLSPFLSPIYAKKTIFGTITDVDTGLPLTSATIQVEGTNTGTVANSEGKYRLFIAKLPALVEVRYVGYEPKRIAITLRSTGQQDLRLKPAEMPSTIVEITGEDPAVRIMKKVIEAKQDWFEDLNTYTSETFSRFDLIKKSREFVSKEPEIIQMIEANADAYWDKTRGTREWIRAKRYIPNRIEDFPYAGLEPVQNFYDNSVWLQGRSYIAPTHPNALDEYSFRLGDQRASSTGEKIYDIYCTPKRDYDRTLRGRITVRIDDYAMLSIELQPNKLPVSLGEVRDRDALYTQNFMEYGGKGFFPLDFNVEGRVSFGLRSADRPPANYKQVSRIIKYRLNEPVLGELYLSNQRLQTEWAAETRADLLKNMVDMIPMTEAELKAVATLTGRFSLMSEFQPMGLTISFGAGGGGLTMDKEQAALNVSTKIDAAMAGYMSKLNDIAHNHYQPDWGRYFNGYYERLLGRDKQIIDEKKINMILMLDRAIRQWMF
jgi:hypothetical protein